MSLSKSVNLAHAQRAVPCNMCEDEAPGEYYCIECKQTLCPQCEKLHRKFTKGHNVVLRTQIGDVGTTVLSCTDHGDQVSVHCDKCNIPVCIKCVTGKHQGHKMVDLTERLQKEKKLLENDINRMQIESLPKLKKRRDEIIAAKEKYENTVHQITKEMEAESQALQKRHEERIKHLVSIQDSELATYDGYSKEIKLKIHMYEKRISEYQDAIGKNTLPALINVTKGKQSLPETVSESVLPEPPTFVPGNIDTIVENLGKLHASSSSLVLKPLKLTTPTVVSEFKCPLQGWPSICITKGGDVWLGGDESREIIQVNIKGQVVRRRRVQKRFTALAVMDCGDVIISTHGYNSRSVSRLLNNDTESRVFDATPFFPKGVSVTADQKILICTTDGRVVRTNCDGTNVKQIYKGSGNNSLMLMILKSFHMGYGYDTVIHAVENSDGNIYISDSKNSAVVMVSKDGKVLSTITHTTGGQRLGGPCGLVVDKMGNILCADRDNDCVYIIDQNQQMRELVGRSHDIQYPCWLAVDVDNNLWITQDNGTVHVVKYYSPLDVYDTNHVVV